MKIKLLGFTPEQEEAFDEALQRETDALHAKREEELYHKEGLE